jgi:hypothetical protein
MIKVGIAPIIIFYKATPRWGPGVLEEFALSALKKMRF